VVLTAVFNAYFVSVVADDSPNATLAWTILLSLSYLFVMVLAPWVGAYVDARGGRRRALVVCTIVCATATAGLAWVGPGDWVMAAAFLLLSNFFYATHQDLSAAYLRELAPPDRLGRLSGFGWSVGYLGGLVTLVLALVWVMAGPQELFDMPLAQVQMSGAMWVTAAVFLTVGLVALSQLPETHAATHAPWQQAWTRLVGGWREMGEHRALRSFLGCVLVYQSGVATVIALAAIYAQQALGFGMAQTIVLLLVVNITASLGAFLFGKLQDRLGHRASLSMALVLWMLRSEELV
jgi:UMF1 family MFS transporter